MITKIWLIIATSLTILGCTLFVVFMSSLGWDFNKLSTVKYERCTYELSEEFDSISMTTDTADIIFVLSDDGKSKVECYEKINAKHVVATENRTLSISLVDHRRVYDYVGLNFGCPKITVYLAKPEYTSLLIRENTGNINIPNAFTFQNVDISLSTGDVDFRACAENAVKIQTTTGDISLKSITAASLDLTVTTGKVNVSEVVCTGDITVDVSTGKTDLFDIRCRGITSTGNTGDISLCSVIASEKLSVQRSTGDIILDSTDAGELLVQTDTGDVTGTLLTPKVFMAQTSTGRINVPETTTGGKCEIDTDTGDIRLEITQYQSH